MSTLEERSQELSNYIKEQPIENQVDLLIDSVHEMMMNLQAWIIHQEYQLPYPQFAEYTAEQLEEANKKLAEFADYFNNFPPLKKLREAPMPVNYDNLNF